MAKSSERNSSKSNNLNNSNLNDPPTIRSRKSVIQVCNIVYDANNLYTCKTISK